MVRIKSAKPIENYIVEIGFSNGERKTIDLKPYLLGDIFESIKNDRDVFKGIKVDHVAGTIYWSNGADIDPDVLFGSEVPHWAENKVSR